MGTSRAAKAPRTRKWNQVIGALRAPDRDGATVAHVTLSVAINALPAVHPLAVPMTYAISEGLRFALDVKNHGIEVAAKRGALRLSDRYVVPSISDSLWNSAAGRMDSKFANSAFSRLAEQAFKKTMSRVLSKGARAFADEESE